MGMSTPRFATRKKNETTASEESSKCHHRNKNYNGTHPEDHRALFFRASLSVLVPRKDGIFQLRIDYHTVNAKTQIDAYPMPLVHKCLEFIYPAH